MSTNTTASNLSGDALQAHAYGQTARAQGHEALPMFDPEFRDLIHSAPLNPEYRLSLKDAWMDGYREGE